jgi:hypothetical protein
MLNNNQSLDLTIGCAHARKFTLAQEDMDIYLI